MRIQQQKDWLNLMFESRMTPHDDNKKEEIGRGALHHIELLPTVIRTNNNVLQFMSKDQRSYTIDPARIMGNRGDKDMSPDHGATTLLDTSRRALVGYHEEFGLNVNDDRSIDNNNNNRSNARVICEREIADASRASRPCHPSLVLEEDVSMGSISSKSSDFSIGVNSVCPLYPMEDHINTNHIGVHTGMIKARDGLHSIVWGCLNNAS